MYKRTVCNSTALLNAFKYISYNEITLQFYSNNEILKPVTR